MTPEKVDFREMDNFAQNLFVRAFMRKQKELGLNKITEVCPHAVGDPYDVVLTVNGVQLPFMEVLNELREGIGDMDNEQMTAWVNEKFGPFSEILHRFEEEMKWALENLLREKFPNHPREE